MFLSVTSVHKCPPKQPFENSKGRKTLPGANIRNEKDEKEDSAKAIEPASHPATNHTLMTNYMAMSKIKMTVMTFIMMIGDDECDKEEDDELHLTDREASLN